MPAGAAPLRSFSSQILSSLVDPALAWGGKDALVPEMLVLVLVLVLVAEMLLCQGRFLLATLLFVVSDRV